VADPTGLVGIILPVKVCRGCGESKPCSAYSRHSGTKDGLRPKCKDCCRIELAKWRRESPAHREYLERNREQLSEQRRRYYESRREEFKARSRHRQQTKPKQVAETKRRYYEANREQIAKAQRQYYEAHREDFFRRAARRRAMKRLAPSESIDYETVFERDEGLCGLCGEPVSPDGWHLDHVVPLARGGSHTYGNVQVAHPRCNLSKGAKLPKGVV
jgi:5-methylcytosine-specific restriction endonuclease McrA